MLLPSWMSRHAHIIYIVLIIELFTIKSSYIYKLFETSRKLNISMNNFSVATIIFHTIFLAMVENFFQFLSLAHYFYLVFLSIFYLWFVFLFLYQTHLPIFIRLLSIFISDICQSSLAALPRVPLMMSIWSIHPSLSPTPAPCSPYSPTAWTSSTKVRAPYLWATSHISLSGEISPIQNKTGF